MSLTAARRSSLADKIAAEEIALKAELEAVEKSKKRASKEA